jgi:hypothetical protein
MSLRLFHGESTDPHLADFFALTEDSELLFGDSELCG